MVTLRLKVIDHYGVAIRSKVSGFDELSGVDVIVLHRLLKNEVKGSEYLRLTEPAYRFLKPPPENTSLTSSATTISGKFNSDSARSSSPYRPQPRKSFPSRMFSESSGTTSGTS
jgi:hypothetical protein